MDERKETRVTMSISIEWNISDVRRRHVAQLWACVIRVRLLLAVSAVWLSVMVCMVVVVAAVTVTAVCGVIGLLGTDVTVVVLARYIQHLG
jgi:uncharacterized membrane protein